MWKSFVHMCHVTSLQIIVLWVKWIIDLNKYNFDTSELLLRPWSTQKLIINVQNNKFKAILIDDLVNTGINNVW